MNTLVRTCSYCINTLFIFFVMGRATGREGVAYLGWIREPREEMAEWGCEDIAFTNRKGTIIIPLPCLLDRVKALL